MIFSIVIELHDLTINTLEAVWIELSPNRNEKLIVGSLYRPPDANCEYFEKMLDVLEKIRNENTELILLGDMKIDYKLDTLSNNPINTIENSFILTQLVDEPTRVTNDSSKCIDHILSSVPTKHEICQVAKISLSDHYMIFTCVNFLKELKDHSTRRFRDYKNFDRLKFIEDIKDTDCFQISSIPDDICVNAMWNQWKSAFLGICQKSAPIREARVKSRVNPWMTPEIVKLIYRRDYLNVNLTRLNANKL